MKQQGSNALIQFGLIILAILIISGGGMFFLRTYEELDNVKNQLTKENNTLENRIQVLSSSSGELQQYAETAYRAIPETNVGLFSLNTIRNIVNNESLLINNVYINSHIVTAADKQRSEIGFEIEGQTPNVFNFLTRVARSLPFVRLTELETRVDEQNFANTTITLEAYSKPLPETLPTYKEPLPALSESDRQTLSDMATYEYPEISAEPNEEGGQFGRENPFSPVSTLVVE